MRAAALAVLCLCAVVTSAAAAAPPLGGAFKQCGGTAGCEAHSSCADAPWTDVKCIPGFGCQRQSAAVWQCTNDPVAVREAKALEEAAAAVAAAEAPGAAGANKSAATAGPAAAKDGAGAPKTYPAITVGDRPSAPATQTCACVDVGINDPACFKGITKYCEMKDPPANVAACEAMSGFYNMQNMTAAKVVARFLVDTCKVTLPPSPNACACLEGRDTPGCKAATINACLVGNAMCGALAFGSEADMASQEAYARFAGDHCGGAMAAAEVGMNFTDVNTHEFLTKYARGAAAALAVISGQPITSVILLPVKQIKVMGPAKPAAAAGRRRLAQAGERPVNKVLTTFQIRSSPQDAPQVLERLELAGSDGGAGLFQALAANGVPLQPSFSIQNGPPLVGAVKTRKLHYGQRAEPLEQGEIVGIAVGASVGAAVIAGLVAFMVVHKRRERRRYYEAKAAAKAKAEAAAAGANGGGGGDAAPKLVDSQGSAKPAAARQAK